MPGMSDFDAFLHPRDVAGKFTEKRLGEPEVTLAGPSVTFALPIRRRVTRQPSRFSLSRKPQVEWVDDEVDVTYAEHRIEDSTLAFTAGESEYRVIDGEMYRRVLLKGQTVPATAEGFRQAMTEGKSERRAMVAVDEEGLKREAQKLAQQLIVMDDGNIWGLSGEPCYVVLTRGGEGVVALGNAPLQKSHALGTYFTANEFEAAVEYAHSLVDDVRVTEHRIESRGVVDIGSTFSVPPGVPA